MSAARVMALWIPDWSVHAAAREQRLPAEAPVALSLRGEIFAANAPARREGIRRGLRLREAQERCATLVVIPYDEAADHRLFDPLIALLEQIVPGIQLLRPGLCLLPARGPARYYGGESEAAERLLAALEDPLATGAVVGIADGIFAAQRVAFTPGPGRVRSAAPDTSPAFLAPLPVDVLGLPELAVLLHKLGLHTLGAFAGLDRAAVRERFGAEGVQAHLIAAGEDPRRVRPRIPAAELAVMVEFEPALDRADQIAFGFRSAAERFIHGLAEVQLVATAIRVEVTGERGGFSARSWLHPRWLNAGDVLDRVRWQLQGAGGAGSGLAEAVARLRVEPETLESAGTHEPGLWGGGPDTRIHNGLTRLQGMVGHDGVLTAAITGGRSPRERTTLVPWGDRAPAAAGESAPWPGRLPGSAPGLVFDPPRPARVCDAAGEAVTVDERGAVSAAPRILFLGATPAAETGAGAVAGGIAASAGEGRGTAVSGGAARGGAVAGQVSGQSRGLPRGPESRVVALFPADPPAGRLPPARTDPAPAAGSSGAPRAVPGERAFALGDWAGPWPVRERWWAGSAASGRADRFQLVDESGHGWLAVHGEHSWWVEARYD
ncbi:DNA polymerase Y family protein [Mycetocola spongiae]|uniref:DNA polymerase Y family protein n=1 Tax=Mycetocola spongiae TaxID=2859226 RepID=UPI001CF56C74|nr:DNA polymerase Y family protein [Mycetocola spongiae]UCR88733.1 DNA polymerase Y family protein [Mycetocola spongiae]